MRTKTRGITAPLPLFCGKPRKRVGRDVATRYILRFGGSTRAIQTDVDDMEVYLQNHFGLVIATVSMHNTFPEKVNEQIFDDIPY